MNCPRRTGVLTKQEILLGRGAPVESSRVRDPELFCHMACSLGFYGDGISFWVVFDQSFWLRVLAGGAHIAQPTWTPVKTILVGGQIYGISFWLCLNSSDWWWLVSSVFLTRTSSHKISQADGYCGTWSRGMVSVSVSLLTFEQVWKSSVSMLSVCMNICECVCTLVYVYEVCAFVSVCGGLGIYSIPGDTPVVHS